MKNIEEKQKEFTEKLQALLKEYDFQLGISNPQIIVLPKKQEEEIKK